MQHLDHFKTYQSARGPCAAAYRLAASIAGDGNLRDQIRRAATSVILNLAEGRGRASDADFARFLVMARGSNTELTPQLVLAVDLGLLGQDEVQPVVAGLDVAGRQMTALIARLRAGG